MPVIFLNATISKEPGIIIGPILKVLGFIIDGIYNFVSLFAGNHALGLSVILLTIVARTLILPFAFRSQKSMTKMQLLQPEINKIKAKYGDSKDPEIVKKIQMEQQALYQKNKVNPLMGCLPMLITLPIFFALNSLFRETYRYIGRIGDLYTQISNAIISVPGFNAIPAFRELVRAKLPKGVAFDFFKAADVSKAVNVFTPADWAGVQAAFPAEGWAGIAALLEKKDATETFLTLNMVSPAGLKWPGIVIPILVAATTLLSSFIMMKTSNNQDSQQKTQTYMMMIVMPVMMFMFTINMSSGVGIYWIVSSVYQTVQQYLLNKYYSKRITLDTAPKKVKAK